MSRSELTAWVSLASTSALLVVYSIFMFSLELPYGFRDVFWKFVLVVVVVEVVLDMTRNRSGKPERDERDEHIEARSYRYAYRGVMIAVMVLIGNLFAMNLMQDTLDPEYVAGTMQWAMHYLVFVAGTASLVKSATQVVLYRGH